MKGFLLFLSYHKENIRLFLSAVAILAAVHALFYLVPAWERKKVEGWPMVEATVIDRTIVERHPRDHRSLHTNITADLTLDYECDGDNYRQHILVPNVHRNRLSYFKTTESVIVRVSPHKPGVPAFRFLDQDFTVPTSSIARHP